MNEDLPSRSRISVIIPTWNERPLIEDAILRARDIGDEVIVSDGGSPDGTARAAATTGACVVTGPKGRGRQLNLGAASARGDILLFLHADARLPGSARGAMLKALSDRSIIGGGFYVKFLPASWFTRLLEPANDLRRRVSRTYYGDTGIFVRASAYENLGGFRDWPIMHDFDFTKRMERSGPCAYIREPQIYASARRFRGSELRTLATWLSIRGLYLLGCSPHWLARLYPDVRGCDPEKFLHEARNALADFRDTAD